MMMPILSHALTEDETDPQGHATARTNQIFEEQMAMISADLRKVADAHEIDAPKPIYAQTLHHSMTEEEAEKMVQNVAADMRKAIRGNAKPDAAPKMRKAMKGKEPAAVDGFKIVDGGDWIWAGKFDENEEMKVDEVLVRHSIPMPDEEAKESQRAVSVAMKAFTALCRRGIETVELDGETIDLWDVKRDLRSLLGSDSE